MSHTNVDKVPKSRTGSFFLESLGVRRRWECAANAAHSHLLCLSPSSYAGAFLPRTNMLQSSTFLLFMSTYFWDGFLDFEAAKNCEMVYEIDLHTISQSIPYTFGCYMGVFDGLFPSNSGVAQITSVTLSGQVELPF